MSNQTNDSQKYDKNYDNPNHKTDAKSEQTIEVIKNAANADEKTEKSAEAYEKSYESDEIREKVITASEEQLESASKA